MKLLVVLILIFSIYTVQKIESIRVHTKKLHSELKDIPKFKTYYTTQFLDHFNSRDDRTFQQRFLLNGNKS